MSQEMKSDDPAYWMLSDGHTTEPTVYKESCYICRDPEFAQMGLPLCYPCSKCKGHVQVDGNQCCDDCGYDQQLAYFREESRKQKHEDFQIFVEVMGQ